MLQITIHKQTPWGKVIMEHAYDCVLKDYMSLPVLYDYLEKFSETMAKEYATFPQIDMQIINNCLLLYADLNHIFTFKTEL